MRPEMAYALDKKMISVNPAEGVDLPKQKKKTEFRTRHIDEQKTLNQKQVEVLIEAAKKTPIYLQVMFAVLMGLRRSEIIGVKYSDIDYINRTLHVERQLGKVPMSKKEDYKPKTYTKQEIDVYGFCGVRIGNINHEYCVRHIEVLVTSIFFSLIVVYYPRMP